MSNFYFVVGISLLLVVGGLFVFNQGSLTGSSINSVVAQGDVQIVKLSVSGANYVLNPSTINKGPVRLVVDSSVSGCARSIVIPSFGVRKLVSSSDNTIEFNADESGTFNIACSMNMYRGSFTVLDNSGKVSGFVEPVDDSPSSCGSSGGCGCGS
ncbi:hypothetical protein COU61_01835 [Candidatus Pacearchaeota archaeon CG10_big_fil_rev_8_21_14_0_10_35_13]|nr:MAG: hypothetical protein COU61_01835 [Candidatus Pacearchaeota archaeon CG10_big_fil_rev_8_21_14_0_10_35_13]